MLSDSRVRGRKELFWLAFRGLVGRLWLGVGGSLWYHTSLKEKEEVRNKTVSAGMLEPSTVGAYGGGLPRPAQASVL